MTNDEPFMLFDFQVPEHAECTTWPDYLRWLVCVMNHDDKALAFICSVLSMSLKNGLTDRQAKASKKILTRICEDFEAGVLDCQNNEPFPSYDDQFGPMDLANMKPKGEA